MGKRKMMEKTKEEEVAELEDWIDNRIIDIAVDIIKDFAFNTLELNRNMLGTRVDILRLFNEEKALIKMTGKEENEKCKEKLIKFFTTKPNIKIEGKREWLDNEIDKIMKKDIQKVIMACLQSGMPCDPETSDAIKEIEACLERLEKEAEK